mmetsp:Transcript_6400/g.25864  ORF Transcript_6400/g.25864 Transcript_6400/m.25864 type:complete len:423 (-) Transcript_6400:5767-7035(-)
MLRGRRWQRVALCLRLRLPRARLRTAQEMLDGELLELLLQRVEACLRRHAANRRAYAGKRAVQHGVADLEAPLQHVADLLQISVRPRAALRQEKRGALGLERGVVNMQDGQENRRGYILVLEVLVEVVQPNRSGRPHLDDALEDCKGVGIQCSDLAVLSLRLGRCEHHARKEGHHELLHGRVEGPVAKLSLLLLLLLRLLLRLLAIGCGRSTSSIDFHRRAPFRPVTGRCSSCSCGFRTGLPAGGSGILRLLRIRFGVGSRRAVLTLALGARGRVASAALGAADGRGKPLALDLPVDHESNQVQGKAPVFGRRIGWQAEAAESIDDLGHKLRTRLVEQVRVADDQLPNVDQMRHAMALLNENFLGVADPYREAVFAAGKPPRQRRGEHIERLAHQRASLRLARPQKSHKDLQDDLLWRLVHL